MIRAIPVFVLAVLAMALCPPAASAQAQATPAKKTLYQRMGGYDAIAGIVGDFLKQLGQDHAFDRFGQGRGQNSLDRARQLIIEQICQATGGPCVYLGRDMKTAHHGLKITQAEWEAAGNHLKASLTKFNVAEADQTEFMAIVESLRPDIVEAPAAKAGMDSKPKAN